MSDLENKKQKAITHFKKMNENEKVKCHRRHSPLENEK